VLIYDSSTETVSEQVITITEILNDGTVVVSSGLSSGDVVVTAGIHSIKVGEKVKLLPVKSTTNIGGLL
jgi:multidrug efflux pump subunit AcrA (membrane-fusion protein)